MIVNLIHSNQVYHKTITYLQLLWMFSKWYISILYLSTRLPSNTIDDYIDQLFIRLG